jgi:hypothetical protein
MSLECDRATITATIESIISYSSGFLLSIILPPIIAAPRCFVVQSTGELHDPRRAELI